METMSRDTQFLIKLRITTNCKIIMMLNHKSDHEVLRRIELQNEFARSFRLVFTMSVFVCLSLKIVDQLIYCLNCDYIRSVI